MAVNINEIAKQEIEELLSREGYPTYAYLLDFFDLILTEDPEVVAYMVPDKAVIVVNKNLNFKQVSMVIRHEILHEWLSHAARAEKVNKKRFPKTPQKEGDPDYDIGKANAVHDLANIAADYDLVNQGMTDKDKITIRSLTMNGEIMRGLVTEDDHPDWVKLSFEEMYEKLLDLQEKEDKALQKVLEKIAKLHKKLSQEELSKLIDEIDKQNAQKGAEGDPGYTINMPRDGGEGKGEGSGEADGKDGEKGAKATDGNPVDGTNDGAMGARGEQAKREVVGALRRTAAEDAAGTFMTQEVLRAQEERAKRVEQIKKAFSGASEKDMLGTVRKKRAEQDYVKAQEEAQKYNSQPLVMFANDIRNFIAKEVGRKTTDTWSRFHKSSVVTGLIKKGHKSYSPNVIPLINVYIDVSGSFDPPKVQGARDALKSLAEFERKGKIKTKVRYFADRVSTNPDECGFGNNGNSVLDNILETHPDNVVLITDSGGFLNTPKTTITVPGAVWKLYYDRTTDPDFDKCLFGEKETKDYLVTSEYWGTEGPSTWEESDA